MRNSLTALILSSALLGAGALAASAPSFSPSFLGAGAGSALAYDPLALPPVALSGGGPGSLPLAARSAVWTPSTEELLTGETVITSHGQMKDVWERLFGVPYDPSLVDFTQSFVVLVGGGFLPPGASFYVSAVESVQASYANAGGLGGDTELEPFLSLTATTFLPGVQPADPPPGSFQVSAVKLAKALQDDIVFHRRLIAGV